MASAPFGSSSSTFASTMPAMATASLPMNTSLLLLSNMSSNDYEARLWKLYCVETPNRGNS